MSLLNDAHLQNTSDLKHTYDYSPSSSGQVSVNKPLPQNLFVKELIGQENQEGGHGLEQDVVSDVPTATHKETARSNMDWY